MERLSGNKESVPRTKVAWSQTTTTKPEQNTSITSDIFTDEELQLVSHILDLVKLWSLASSLHDASSVDHVTESGDQETEQTERKYQEAVKQQLRDTMRFIRKKLYQSGVIQCLSAIVTLPDQPESYTLLKVDIVL